MAEFFDVMVEMRRMHDDYDDCNDGCPLSGKGFCNKPYCEMDEEDIKEAEKIIMEWSKEHPKVVHEAYPTWGEWLTQIGVAQLGCGMLGIHPVIAKSRIPDDIAKKFGLEPVRKRK
jgi:hypothetical protein